MYVLYWLLLIPLTHTTGPGSQMLKTYQRFVLNVDSVGFHVIVQYYYLHRIIGNKIQ